MNPSDTIATRTLELIGENCAITVQLWLPVKDPEREEHYCTFVIRGVDNETLRTAGRGVDGFQALIHALIEIDV